MYKACRKVIGSFRHNLHTRKRIRTFIISTDKARTKPSLDYSVQKASSQLNTIDSA